MRLTEDSFEDLASYSAAKPKLDAVVVDLKGVQQRIDAHKGKIVVLDLWALW